MPVWLVSERACEVTVRIGVVGAGRIGRLHAEVIARKIPDATLVAVADVVSASADALAGELQVESASVAELIASDAIDAVAICTSTDTHVDITITAAQAGKAVFCEKPISLDLTEVDRALAAVAAAGTPYMVGFNRRFDPAHHSVREAVLSGEVGEVHMARITSRDPSPPPVSYVKVSGGLYVDMMIHDFDMARYVVGSPVVEVFAKGAVRIDPEIGEAGDIDTAMVLLTHANGAFTTIDNSRRATYGYDQRVEVFGSGGMAFSTNPPVHTGSFLGGAGLQGTVIPNFFLERYTDSFRLEWEAFVRYVRDGGPSPVSGADGRAPVAIGLAAGESLRTGQPVALVSGQG
jgi:myo-inositol 2-dehydrogenase / D-chiro-inositol 1-dehydrogenase